jgi:hypothetical protein
LRKDIQKQGKRKRPRARKDAEEDVVEGESRGRTSKYIKPRKDIRKQGNGKRPPARKNAEEDVVEGESCDESESTPLKSKSKKSKRKHYEENDDDIVPKSSGKKPPKRRPPSDDEDFEISRPRKANVISSTVPQSAGKKSPQEHIFQVTTTISPTTPASPKHTLPLKEKHRQGTFGFVL